jgi:Uma2 family endonuclease
MAGPAVPHKPLSVEEYLELEETATLRHEYVGGMIYAHAGGTIRHNVISGNIFGQWWLAEAVGPEGVAPIPCPEVELTLTQIYEGLYA